MARSEDGQRVYGGTRTNAAWVQGKETSSHGGGAELFIGLFDFPFSLAADTALFPVTLIFAIARTSQWSLDR